MSTLFVNNLNTASGSTITVPTGKKLVAPGHVLQVQHFQLTTSQEFVIGAAHTDYAITNFTVNITPVSTSSIIKLEAQLFHEHANAVHSSVFFFYRDSTKLANTQSSPSNRKIGIAVGTLSYYDNDAATTPDMLHMGYFDSPSSTSAIAYKLGVNMNGSNNLFINRTINDTDSNGNERGVSWISATEIAQ